MAILLRSSSDFSWWKGEDPREPHTGEDPAALLRRIRGAEPGSPGPGAGRPQERFTGNVCPAMGQVLGESAIKTRTGFTPGTSPTEKPTSGTRESRTRWAFQHLPAFIFLSSEAAPSSVSSVTVSAQLMKAASKDPGSVPRGPPPALGAQEHGV